MRLRHRLRLGSSRSAEDDAIPAVLKLKKMQRVNEFTNHNIVTTTTTRHIEKTDAGLDRPLYLRNKLYDKTLKSQNYYSNILQFPVPWRSALWLYNTSWLH